MCLAIAVRQSRVDVGPVYPCLSPILSTINYYYTQIFIYKNPNAFESRTSSSQEVSESSGNESLVVWDIPSSRVAFNRHGVCLFFMFAIRISIYSIYGHNALIC